MAKPGFGPFLVGFPSSSRNYSEVDALVRGDLTLGAPRPNASSSGSWFPSSRTGNRCSNTMPVKNRPAIEQVSVGGFPTISHSSEVAKDLDNMTLLLDAERSFASSGRFVAQNDGSRCERISRALESAREQLDKYKSDRPEHCKRPPLTSVLAADDPFPDDDECNTEAIAFWEYFIDRFEMMKRSAGCP